MWNGNPGLCLGECAVNGDISPKEAQRWQSPFTNGQDPISIRDHQNISP